MTEDQLKSMTEQEIRARFRCAPAYYLQAKLEKKRALEGGRPAAPGHDEARRDAAPEPARWWTVLAASLDLAPARPRRPMPPSVESQNPPPPLPGFEILDAALTESGSLDTADVLPAIPMNMDMDLELEAGLTQQAILEAALEDYANWPLRSAPEPDAQPQAQAESHSELERKLTLVLEAAPELRLVLDEEPELEVVLHSEPELERALDAEAGFMADNVTTGDFGQRAPRTVPVVSVVMDRKRPNMVRVVGRSTRLAS